MHTITALQFYIVITFLMPAGLGLSGLQAKNDLRPGAQNEWSYERCAARLAAFLLVQEQLSGSQSELPVKAIVFQIESLLDKHMAEGFDEPLEYTPWFLLRSLEEEMLVAEELVETLGAENGIEALSSRAKGCM